MAAFALEDGMLADAHLDIQVPGRSPVAARLALPVEADAVAGIDAGGHIDGQRLLLAHTALSKAGVAGVADDLAPALTARAGLLDREDRLLHAYLPLAVECIASFGGGAFGGARARADLAFGERGDLNLGIGAEHRLFEVEFEFVAQIGAAKYLGSAALSAGENIAEHLAEDVAECLTGAESAAPASLEAGMSELIVNGAFFRVAEDLVGFLGLFESMFRLRIIGIAVRMMLHGEAAIRLFDVGLGRASGQIEELIVILLRHCSPGASLKTNRRDSGPAVQINAIPCDLKPSCDRFP